MTQMIREEIATMTSKELAVWTCIFGFEAGFITIFALLIDLSI